MIKTSYLKKKNHIKKSENAITIVGLVVTIIVLIIITGTSMRLLLGDNGIITKGKDAKENYQEASKGEKINLNELDNEMSAQISEIQEDNIIRAGQTAKEENKTYNDGSNTAIIPKGFTVSGIPEEQTIQDGLVIYDLEEVDISTWDEAYWTNNKETIQSTYNQYVWVPVTDTLALYEGYWNKSLGEMVKDCTEPLDYNSKKAAEWETNDYEAMKESVESNQGFYIARYEASKNTTTNKAESKKGKKVWKKIKWGDSMTSIGTEGAVYNAKHVYNNNENYNVTSTLVYGCQWDAILVWMDSNYKTGTCEETSYIVDSTGYGNYSNTKNTYGAPGNTGIFAVRNIYDMAGNVREWTMEAFKDVSRVRRGGYYDREGSNNPVSNRNSNYPTSSENFIGFRVALYIV